jgi:hypothetical protein
MNALVENPFGTAVAESAGSRQLQARENAEVMALAMMAKRFPRDTIKAADRIINAFSRIGLAEVSQYQYSKGGSDIAGPSIRAAEAIAQQWGNMSSGWSELSRSVGPDGVGVSEVEAFCIDYETVNQERLKFFVRHWRDTSRGGYALKDERDIYELCANQAQRRKRACILAQLPGDIIAAAINQATVTLRTKADTSPEAMTKMVEAFGTFGVTRAQIEKRIQRRLDAIQPAQVVTLKRIYASLRDGVSDASEWFEDVEDGAGAGPATTSTAAAGDAAATERETYPAAQFAKDIVAWGKVIASGKKKADDIIKTATSKYALSEEQKAAIHALAQPQQQAQADAPPAMTFAQVSDLLNKAEGVDALNDAANHIQRVPDEGQRKELGAIYDARFSTFQE